MMTEPGEMELERPEEWCRGYGLITASVKMQMTMFYELSGQRAGHTYSSPLKPSDIGSYLSRPFIQDRQLPVGL